MTGKLARNLQSVTRHARFNLSVGFIIWVVTYLPYSSAHTNLRADLRRCRKINPAPIYAITRLKINLLTVRNVLGIHCQLYKQLCPTIQNSKTVSLGLSVKREQNTNNFSFRASLNLLIKDKSTHTCA